MSIGEVLNRLRPDFPDVSISKIRFLESEGLVEPERTASGYRKFSYADLERLRYILTAQRDHYYPLKVIKEHLDAMERGLEPPTAAGEPPGRRASIHAVGPTSDAVGRSARPRPATCGCRAPSCWRTPGSTDKPARPAGGVRHAAAASPARSYFDADALVVARRSRSSPRSGSSRGTSGRSRPRPTARSG